jgi:competence protein ComEC
MKGGCMPATKPAPTGTPFFVPALAVAAGMAVFSVNPSISRFYSALATGALAAVSGVICRYASMQKTSFFLILVALGAVSGAWHFVRVNTASAGDLILSPPEGEVAVVGKVAAFPVATRTGGYLDIDVFGIETSRKTLTRRSGRVRIAVSEEVWAGFEQDGIPGPGTGIRVETPLSMPSGYLNPGGFDPSYHLKCKGIRLSGYVKHPEFVHILSPSTSFAGYLSLFRSGALRLLDHTRSSAGWLPETLRDDVPFVSKALLLGARGELSPETRQVFQEAGLVHVLAVSGLHVGIIAGVAFWIMKRIPGGIRSRSFVLSLIVWCYAVLTGAGASIIRASTMVSCVMICRMMYRPANSKNVVSLSAIVLLLLQPAWISDPGFQLTFAATGGIVLLYPGLQKRLLWIRRPWLRNALAVSIAAQTATAPVSAWWFNRIGLLSAIAGLPLIPVVAVAMITGLAALCAAKIPFAGPALLRLHGLCTAVLVQGAELETRIPGITRDVPTPSLVVPVAAAAFLAGMTHRDTAGHRTLAACIVIPVFLITGFQGCTGTSETLDIWFLDVGNGDCTVIRLPDNRTLIIDAGGLHDSEYDIGEKVVVRALRTIGINHLDIAVITHPHPDHQLGMKAVIAHFKPKELWIMNPYATDPVLLDIIRLARTHSIAIRFLEKRNIFKVFPMCENNMSVVLSIRYGAFKVVFPGDAEREAEAALLDYGPLLKADVLKVGHHGSRSSCSENFITGVSPKVAFIPCGRNNRFDHPHAETLNILNRQSPKMYLLRSDIHGMVHVCTDGSKAEIRWSTAQPVR